uniref:Small ribosomal subunit protein cS23 n=1 Tax=Phacus orbicularis TaxID=158829 RepID=A0A182B0Y9_9EUGL|nr:putative ribosomal protein 3 [Phacus orbicularis]
MMINKFILKFLWLEKMIGVALDQNVNGKIIPVTEYFFWPRNDAWEDMRLELLTRSWVSKNESILILNQITEVINFWQEQSEVTRKEDFIFVREKFPFCVFLGQD